MGLGASQFQENSGGALTHPAISSNHHHLSKSEPSLRESAERGIEMRSNGLNDRTIIGRRRNNNYADAKIARGDWLSAELAKLPVAEVVAITGMTETAVHNIRRGKCKISHDNLCALLEARPDFRARFFCSVGGELLVRPDQYIAFERAVNEIMRGAE